MYVGYFGRNRYPVGVCIHPYGEQASEFQFASNLSLGGSMNTKQLLAPVQSAQVKIRPDLFNAKNIKHLRSVWFEH